MYTSTASPFQYFQCTQCESLPPPGLFYYNFTSVNLDWCILCSMWPVVYYSLVIVWISRPEHHVIPMPPSFYWWEPRTYKPCAFNVYIPARNLANHGGCNQVFDVTYQASFPGLVQLCTFPYFTFQVIQFPPKYSHYYVPCGLISHKLCTTPGSSEGFPAYRADMPAPPSVKLKI
jgi:hypothetical protein